jgi:hypothetical protein
MDYAPRSYDRVPASNKTQTSEEKTMESGGGANIWLHSSGGISGLSLFDHYAIPRTALDAEHDGTPVLRFYDIGGKLIKQLP